MVCPQCFSGAVHDHAEAQGHFETIHGIKTYVTGDKDATSESVILYLPDFFGPNLSNHNLLADRYAQGTGCKVLFPDIIPGGGAGIQYLHHMEVIIAPFIGDGFPWWSVPKILNWLWAFCASLPLIPLLITASPEKAYPEIKRYARAMRKDLPEGGKLGVCGFCWGGYGSTNLCAEPTVEGGDEPLIDAQFCGHPSRLKAPDDILKAISTYKVPYSAAIAESDFQIDEKLGREIEAVVRQKVGPPEQNDYEFRYYKGAFHGFCVRGRPKVKAEMEAYYAGAKQAIDWFNKYLK